MTTLTIDLADNLAEEAGKAGLLGQHSQVEYPQLELEGTVTIVGDIIETVILEEDCDCLR